MAIDSISSGSQTMALYQQLQSSQAQGAPPKPPSAEDMFGKVSKDVDTDGNGISKDELEAFLEKLQESDSKEDQGKAGLIKKMIQNFDEISSTDGVITADSFKSNFDMLKPDKMGPPPGGPPMQDPSEITSDQLISPIDLRV
jgi:hypothetical protein